MRYAFRDQLIAATLKPPVRPSLRVAENGRNGAHERFGYVVAVTLRADKFAGDLYTKIRQQYPALAPIRLRTKAEIRVRI